MADPNINPLFDLSAVVTDVGLAAASVATPTGPWINIRQFKIADGYGFKASRTDQELTGNILYSAPVTAYRNIPPKTINVMCTIPAIEGPWQFGELGLYIPSNDAPDDPDQDVLFAHLVFPSPQLKTSSLVTNVASTYTFNCLIDLEQSTAIFQINNGELQTIWVVNKWSDVYPQNTMANPEIDLIVVQEPDTYGRSTALTPARPSSLGLGQEWSPQGTYHLACDSSVVAATASTVTIPFADVADWGIISKANVVGGVVIGFPSVGLYRAVASAALSGSNVVFTLKPDPMTTPAVVGSPLDLYVCDAMEANLAGADTIGLMRPNRGIITDRAGVMSVTGLLHGAPGTGRILTSADNLNQGTGWTDAIPSGEYSFFSNSRPQNLPPGTTTGGRVRISAYEGFIIQQVFPESPGNENKTDPNNQAWWRVGTQSLVWTAWRKMGGGGETSSTITRSLGSVNNNSLSYTTTRWSALSLSNTRSESHISIYANGQLLGRDDGEGGGFISYTVPPGTPIIFAHTGKSENCPIWVTEWDIV